MFFYMILGYFFEIFFGEGKLCDFSTPLHRFARFGRIAGLLPVGPAQSGVGWSAPRGREGFVRGRPRDDLHNDDGRIRATRPRGASPLRCVYRGAEGAARSRVGDEQARAEAAAAAAAAAVIAAGFRRGSAIQGCSGKYSMFVRRGKD